jgi:hypothetical protein
MSTWLIIVLAIALLTIIGLIWFFIWRRINRYSLKSTRNMKRINKAMGYLGKAIISEQHLMEIKENEINIDVEEYSRTLENIKVRRLIENYFLDTSPIYHQADEFISELEIANGISLSMEARQLLILPLVEYQRILTEREKEFVNDTSKLRMDFENWKKSITMLIDTMIHQPAQVDRIQLDNEGTVVNMSSMSVIRAFWIRFCNIPPFCGEK